MDLERGKRLLGVVLGVAVVLPLVGVDPAFAALLFDVELLGLVGGVGLAMTRDDLRAAWGRVCACDTVVQFVAGVRLVRAEPRSLLA